MRKPDATSASCLRNAIANETCAACACSETRFCRAYRHTGSYATIALLNAEMPAASVMALI
jgi:hypothetical protein